MVFPKTGNLATDVAQISQWDRALTEVEVLELYNGGKWKSPKLHSAASNLTNWYAFDNTASPADTTDTIKDRQGSTDIAVSDTSGESDTAVFVDGPGDFFMVQFFN